MGRKHPSFPIWFGISGGALCFVILFFLFLRLVEEGGGRLT